MLGWSNGPMLRLDSTMGILKLGCFFFMIFLGILNGIFHKTMRFLGIFPGFDTMKQLQLKISCSWIGFTMIHPLGWSCASCAPFSCWDRAIHSQEKSLDSHVKGIPNPLVWMVASTLPTQQRLATTGRCGDWVDSQLSSSFDLKLWWAWWNRFWSVYTFPKNITVT